MTKWRIINDPSAIYEALMTHKGAMDVKYQCPKCGKDRAVTWLFPDGVMEFTDKCCNTIVRLDPKEGEEE